MKKLQRMLLAFDMVLVFILAGATAEKRTSDLIKTEADAAYIDETKKKIALTFDDGPHEIYTKQLLKGLRERDVKATFFVLGEKAEAYPELIKEMKKDGHLIGNHTYTHIQLTKQNEKQFKEELKKTSEIINQITGEGAMYVRPPYGSWNKELEEELQMFPILWTIDPKDWCSKDTSAVVSNVCKNAEENGIILLHDQYQSSVTAALAIIDRLKADGYEFVTVDELLFE